MDFATPIYEQAFSKKDSSVKLLDIGSLTIKSGRLCACDPFLGRHPAFTRSVPIGRFPVSVSIWASHNDQRIAAALIRFASGEPTAWEQAVTPGQDAATLKPGHIFGYPVDSGTGGFMDEEAWDFIYADEHYSTKLMEAMNATYENTRSWADYRLDRSDLNVMAFSSGIGDGLYPSYFGRIGDTVVCLITDFLMFDVPEASPSTTIKPRWWQFWK